MTQRNNVTGAILDSAWHNASDPLVVAFITAMDGLTALTEQLKTGPTSANVGEIVASLELLNAKIVVNHYRWDEVYCLAESMAAEELGEEPNENGWYSAAVDNRSYELHDDALAIVASHYLAEARASGVDLTEMLEMGQCND